MNLRGRLTLIGVAIVLLAGATLARLDDDPAPETLPAVGAAPPAMPAAAPDALLRRLPPGARGASVGSFVDEEEGRVVERVPVPRDAVERLPVPRDAVERLPAPHAEPNPAFYRVQYSVDPELSLAVERILRRGRVALGHVLLLDIESGRLLAYESTDPSQFPATHAYPMASIMKVVTAAGLLRLRPEAASERCRFVGSPYRLTRARLETPRVGQTATLERALATSNNQCFARIAVHELGADAVADEARRVGLLRAPGPGHDPGSLEDTADDLDLGRLGSGLDGSWVTPLGALRLAAALARGELVEPRWVDAIESAEGAPLRLPEPAIPAQVWPPDVTERLREMLVQTTRSGTARRAFRDRRGRPLLGPVRVAGKTGSLSGREPKGRYEWFVGVAPAEDPTLAIATLVVNGDLWWRSSSQIAADVLRDVFCEDGRCSAATGDALLDRAGRVAPFAAPAEQLGAAERDTPQDRAG